MLDEEPLVLTDEVEETKSIKQNKTLSPAVRKMVVENKINLDEVKGTGKDGRILKGDLISLMGANPQPNERKIQYGEEERIKMSRLRQTIAKRLKEAQNNAAMLTTFNEVDMSNIISMRKDNQEDFQNSYGIKLGFMSFFVKACIVGLKLFPAINAEVENDEMVYKNYYNVSFAVGTEKGLVVPVLKNADEMSFADIEKNIKDLSDKAKNGSLTIEDLQGGTFTISNGGVYGSMLSTPILNPPQSAVLGMHNIVERPVVVDGEIKAFISPSTTTGLSTILCIPRTADCGGFKIGVDNIDPYTPPLLIVNVPPWRSSMVRLPFFALSDRSFMFFSMSAKDISSAFFNTGTTNPFSVPTAKLTL